MTAPQGLRPGPGRLLSAAVFIGTILAIIAVAVLPLLTPAFTHPALDMAGSAGQLAVETGVAHRWSDLSVAELVLGPGSFAFDGPDGPGAGPFYDTAERGHLADARVLLWLCLIAGAVSLLGIGGLIARAGEERRRTTWRIVSRAGATTAAAVIVLGVVSLVAFDALFTLFHQLFFPGGNWAFDPATQHLVQLYPFAFWQIAAAAFGVLVAVLGVATWWLGRRLGRSAALPVEPLPSARAAPPEDR
jgi:integral membrane protein (TIGR01906 family)